MINSDFLERAQWHGEAAKEAQKQMEQLLQTSYFAQTPQQVLSQLAARPCGSCHDRSVGRHVAGIMGHNNGCRLQNVTAIPSLRVETSLFRSSAWERA